MFLNCFRLRYRTKHYKQFKKLYEAFRPRDVVKICDWHHREIHERYSVIVNAHKARLRKRLRSYSWKEAEALMKLLEQECDRWLKLQTPGSPPWHTK